MSDSSRDNGSGGSLKSLKDRLQTKQTRQSFQADGFKKGFSHLSGKTKNIGATLQSMFTPKSDTSVYSKGVRELDEYGYEKYNLEDDGDEIFISRVPEKAMFNDGEPLAVRATGGNFVGSSAPSSASVEVEAEPAQPEDISRFFGNVARGNPTETEYRATVGKVTDEGTIEPTPINNDFLNRMSRDTVNSRASYHIEFEDEVPEEVQAEQTAEVQAEDVEVFVPADVPVADVPEEVTVDMPEEVQAEAPVAEAVAADVPEETVTQNSFLQRMTRTAPVESDRPRIEFFVDDEPEEAPQVEEAQAEDAEDDYSWLDIDGQDDVPVEEPAAPNFIHIDTGETLGEAPAEYDEEPGRVYEMDDVPADVELFVPTEPAQAEVFAEPMEEPEEAQMEIAQEPEAVVSFEAVGEALVEPEAAVMDAEVSAEPMEEPETVLMEPEVIEASEEVEVDVQVEEVQAEAVVSGEIADMPVQPAVMALPSIRVAEPEGITGMTVEGSEPSSESGVDMATVATQEMETAVTGAAAETGVKYSGITEDGEALPPMSDPVVRRPRSMRFRFSNGVLQNVDAEKVEPKEELRDPLA